MKTKIKVGVIGAGHLGRFHIEKLLRMNQINLIGFYDTSSKQSKKIYKDGEGLVIKNKKIQKNPNITFFHKQL